MWVDSTQSTEGPNTKKTRSPGRLLVEQGHGSSPVLSTLGAQGFKLQTASSASAVWLSSLGTTPPTFWISAYRRQVMSVQPPSSHESIAYNKHKYNYMHLLLNFFLWGTLNNTGGQQYASSPLAMSDLE